MRVHSIYTPAGTYQALLVALLLTLLGAVGFLLVFTSASLP
mgnify:CR=1 FL=1